MILPIDAKELVPHRGPMKLVDTLIESDGDNAVVEAVIPAGSPFAMAQGGVAHRCALIELVAQSYAAAHTYEDLHDGKKSRPGYLVGISKASFYDDPRIGVKIIIELHAEDVVGDFYIARGQVKQEGELLLDITLKIWLVPQEQVV